MAERRTGAGAHLSGLVHQATQPKIEPQAAVEPSTDTVEPVAKSRGRAGAVKAPRPQSKLGDPHTVFIPSELYERVIIQSIRKKLTMSEYICWALQRSVPGGKAASVAGKSSGEQGDEAA